MYIIKLMYFSYAFLYSNVDIIKNNDRHKFQITYYLELNLQNLKQIQ